MNKVTINSIVKNVIVLGIAVSVFILYMFFIDIIFIQALSQNTENAYIIVAAKFIAYMSFPAVMIFVIKKQNLKALLAPFTAIKRNRNKL